MLHDIRDVHLRAVYACLSKCWVEEFACRRNKRTTRAVLLICGLFSDQHDFGRWRSFTEDSLRPSFPEITRLAIARGAPQRSQRWVSCPQSISWAFFPNFCARRNSARPGNGRHNKRPHTHTNSRTL